jgi:hypothetical protein
MRPVRRDPLAPKRARTDLMTATEVRVQRRLLPSSGVGPSRPNWRDRNSRLRVRRQSVYTSASERVSHTTTGSNSSRRVRSSDTRRTSRARPSPLASARHVERVRPDERRVRELELRLEAVRARRQTLHRYFTGHGSGSSSCCRSCSLKRASSRPSGRARRRDVAPSSAGPFRIQLEVVGERRLIEHDHLRRCLEPDGRRGAASSLASAPCRRSRPSRARIRSEASGSSAAPAR